MMHEVEIVTVENQLLAHKWAKENLPQYSYRFWRVMHNYTGGVTWDWEFKNERDAVLVKLKFG